MTKSVSHAVSPLDQYQPSGPSALGTDIGFSLWYSIRYGFCHVLFYIYSMMILTQSIIIMMLLKSIMIVVKSIGILVKAITIEKYDGNVVILSWTVTRRFGLLRNVCVDKDSCSCKGDLLYLPFNHQDPTLLTLKLYELSFHF